MISGSGSEVERSLGVREIAGSIPAFPTILELIRGVAQMVARTVRDREVVGSNPAAPISILSTLFRVLFSSTVLSFLVEE